MTKLTPLSVRPAFGIILLALEKSHGPSSTPEVKRQPTLSCRASALAADFSQAHPQSSHANVRSEGIKPLKSSWTSKLREFPRNFGEKPMSTRAEAKSTQGEHFVEARGPDGDLGEYRIIQPVGNSLATSPPTRHDSRDGTSLWVPENLPALAHPQHPGDESVGKTPLCRRFPPSVKIPAPSPAHQPSPEQTPSEPSYPPLPQRTTSGVWGRGLSQPPQQRGFSSTTPCLTSTATSSSAPVRPLQPKDGLKVQSRWRKPLPLTPPKTPPKPSKQSQELPRSSQITSSQSVKLSAHQLQVSSHPFSQIPPPQYASPPRPPRHLSSSSQNPTQNQLSTMPLASSFPPNSSSPATSRPLSHYQFLPPAPSHLHSSATGGLGASNLLKQAQANMRVRKTIETPLYSTSRKSLLSHMTKADEDQDAGEVAAAFRKHDDTVNCDGRGRITEADIRTSVISLSQLSTPKLATTATASPANAKLVNVKHHHHPQQSSISSIGRGNSDKCLSSHPPRPLPRPKESISSGSTTTNSRSSASFFSSTSLTPVDSSSSSNSTYYSCASGEGEGGSHEVNGSRQQAEGRSSPSGTLRTKVKRWQHQQKQRQQIEGRRLNEKRPRGPREMVVGKEVKPRGSREMVVGKDGMRIPGQFEEFR